MYISMQDEGDKDYHHQYSTGNVYEGCNRLWVIQNRDLDFASLEG